MQFPSVLTGFGIASLVTIPSGDFFFDSTAKVSQSSDRKELAALVTQKEPVTREAKLLVRTFNFVLSVARVM